jgi:LAO/AO transport system kinase
MDIQDIIKGIKERSPRAIARAITLVENGDIWVDELLESLDKRSIEETMIFGITGPPGAGKSTLTGKMVGYCRSLGKRVGVIAVDPSSPISGGAIHGDRIRMMEHSLDQDVVIRSMATRGRLGGLCASAGAVCRILASSGCNPIIIETVGVGQSEIDIIKIADVTALVSAPGLGDDIQALKAGLMEVADVMVVNKADKPEAQMLAVELNEIAREKGSEVILTIASEGKGIDKLYHTMEDIYKSQTREGIKEKKRWESRKKEVIDWVIEMIRPEIERKVDLIDPRFSNRDPRIIANSIASKIKEVF